MVLCWVAYLLDEHFSGTGGDSSFGCFLFLLFLWAVAATARITTKQVTNFIPSRIFHPTAQNISNYHSGLKEEEQIIISLVWTVLLWNILALVLATQKLLVGTLPHTDLTKTGNNFYGVKLYSQGRELAQSKVITAATVIRGKFYLVNTNLLTGWCGFYCQVIARSIYMLEGCWCSSLAGPGWLVGCPGGCCSQSQHPDGVWPISYQAIIPNTRWPDRTTVLTKSWAAVQLSRAWPGDGER